MCVYSYKNVLLIFLFPLYIYIHIIQKVLKFYLYVLTFPFIRMEIVDKDFKVGYVSGFQYAVKSVSHFFMSFLETCKSYGLCPSGLNIRKKPFIEFETSDLKVFWNETIKKTEENLLEALCIGICERLLTIEETFWAKLRYLEKHQESEDLKEWLVKLVVHLEREIDGIRGKRKKLKKLCTDETSKQLVDERFLEHSNLFTFFTDLKNFCDDFSPDILNLVNVLTLAFSSVDVNRVSNISTNSDILSNESPNLSSFNKINESSKEPFSERERERSSLTVQLCVIIDMRENLLALTLLIYLAGISLRMKFLFFQKDSTLLLLPNI